MPPASWVTYTFQKHIPHGVAVHYRVPLPGTITRVPLGNTEIHFSIPVTFLGDIR